MKKIVAILLSIFLLLGNTAMASQLPQIPTVVTFYDIFDFDWYDFDFDKMMDYFSRRGLRDPFSPAYIYNDVGILYDTDNGELRVCAAGPIDENRITKIYLWHTTPEKGHQGLLEEIRARFGEGEDANYHGYNSKIWSAGNFLVEVIPVMGENVGTFDQIEAGVCGFTVRLQSQKDYWTFEQATTPPEEETVYSPQAVQMRESIVTPGFNIDILDYRILDKLAFSSIETGGKAQSLYKSKNNCAYVALRCNIKNKTTKEVDQSCLDGVVIVDGYEYTISVFSTTLFFAPLDKRPAYIYALVPYELTNKIKQGTANATFNFSFNDDLSWTGVVGEYQSMDNQYTITP